MLDPTTVDAFLAERIVAGSGELARLAPLGGRHHERLDGSGYHRACTAADLNMSARILAVAVTFARASNRGRTVPR